MRGASQETPVGLIAGEGDFPLLFAETSRALGKKMIAFAIKGCADPKLADFVQEIHWIGLGELEKLTELLKSKNIHYTALAGGIPKKEMYNPAFSMDKTASGLMQSVKNRGDDHLLRALQLYLRVKCGVSILDSRLFLKNAMATKGVLTARQPSREEWDDLRFGWRIAKGIGKMDIGQTVVVKRGVVLAVEAMEGTDNAIRRGAALGQGDAVVVKVCKPGQNLRFDLPCVGRHTLENLKSVSCRVLGIEAGKAIMIYKEKLIETANRENMTIVGM